MPHFSGGPYGPGDYVTGVLVAREPERARTLHTYLRYVDRSPSFSGAETYDAVEPLHEGPVDAGQEIPFELSIPNDAYPNWQDALTPDGRESRSRSGIPHTRAAQRPSRAALTRG
jgi:hypothetical protein